MAESSKKFFASETSLDDQLNKVRDWVVWFRRRSGAGKICRRVGWVCLLVSVVGTSAGVPLGYHEPFLSSKDVVSLLILFAAWISAGIGVILGAASICTSRGLRGWGVLLLNAGSLALSLRLVAAFPGYGLGDLH